MSTRQILTVLKILSSICVVGSLFSLYYPLVRSQDEPATNKSTLGESWSTAKLNSMTLEEKVGQMIMPRFYGIYMNHQSDNFRDLKRLIVENHVGGFILSTWYDEKGVLNLPEVYETALLTNKLQAIGKTPLIFAADFERGAAPRIRRGVSFPENMALGATGSEELAYFEGKVTAEEARALGIQWTFAPVADVNNNPKNPIINTRAFGEDPQEVAKLVAAYVRGAQENGIIATAKHFPGHGNTGVDSHTSLALIEADKQRLEEIELIPFKAAISAGVGSIMTAHIAIPKVAEDSKTPATLSHTILTGILRNELGFTGLIVTDAMEMGGITRGYSVGEAAVKAVKAGADMILLPLNPNASIRSLVEAVKRGLISQTRINESVDRILQVKAQLGLNKNPFVKVEQIDTVLGSEANKMKAQEIADRSITLVKNDNQVLPIAPHDSKSIFNVIVTDERDPDVGAIFLQEVRKRTNGAKTVIIDQRSCNGELNDLPKRAEQASLILCSVFSRWRDRKGTVAVPEKQAQLIGRLLRLGKPVVLTSFGSPYILTQFPRAKIYLCAYGLHDVSQRAAAKAIFGEIEISGKLPISLPGLFPRGHGLTTNPRKQPRVQKSADYKNSVCMPEIPGLRKVY